MAQNSEDLGHHHHQYTNINHTHNLRRTVNNSNNRQIISQSAETSDSHSNDRTIPFLQSELWRDHYKDLTKKLKEELRQNPENRRSCCYKDINPHSNLSSNINNKNGLLLSNNGSKSKIPVKQNGTTLSSKRKISDSNNSIPRISDIELNTGSQSVCQVCQVKEIRSNLMQLNKEVLEQNDKILRLKDQFLREFFERGLIKNQ